MTFDELQKAGFVEHHQCALCGAHVGYQIHPFMAAAVFNRSCDCSGGESWSILTHEELASIPSAKEKPE